MKEAFLAILLINLAAFYLSIEDREVKDYYKNYIKSI